MNGISAGKKAGSIVQIRWQSITFPRVLTKMQMAARAKIGDNARFFRLRALLSLTLAAARHCAL
ncbi:MAG: hypothetical protein V4723_15800 [Pseudomonadota bacterium]